MPPTRMRGLASGAPARLRLIALALGAALALSAGGARAQAIVSSINGDPITNIDVDERMKMLRVMRKPATREAALESLYRDRLETREAGKYGVNIRDSDLSTQIVKTAQELKMAPDALISALQGAGVTQDHFKAHFRAELAFSSLIQALNKGVEASESQVREELAKQGGKAAAGTQYTVQQIIFTLPNGAAPATINERGREAEQLRARFNDCESGVAAARSLNDVTIRDPLTRTSAELGEALRQLLDKTPIGHLTPPTRSSAGLEMVAVCSKGAAKDDSAVRNAISQKLLAAHIAEDAARRLKEMRARAVIVQH